MRIALWTPVTPARESASGTSGVDACRSSVSSSRGSVISGRCDTESNRSRALVTDDTRFARLVSLACHDVRTPLATVHGFAKTLARTGELGEPAASYVEMIGQASEQITELVDELGLAARIEAGRYEPTTRPTDTLELARAAAERLGADRVEVAGEGAEVRVDEVASERAVAALARCALR